MALDIIGWIHGWKLSQWFSHFKANADKVAIAVTQAVKTALEGQVAQSISAVLDEIFKTHIAEDVLAVLKVAALKTLAIELAIQGIPDNPSGDDILNFEKQVWEAITGKSPQDKAKLWTTFAAQFFVRVKALLGENTTLTFAQIVILIEQAYQDYLSDLAQAA